MKFEGLCSINSISSKKQETAIVNILYVIEVVLICN